MKIGIDISPIKTLEQHRVRGTGFYTKNLVEALEKNFPDNKYIFFTKDEKLKENVDIVHYPYFEPFFLTLPLIKKQKTIVTIHDLTPLIFPDYFPSGIKGKTIWNLQKLILRNIDGVITDSESSKKDIVRITNFPSEKIAVIYLAASSNYKVVKDINKKKYVFKKYKLPEKFILYVGDVTWNKNLPKIIQAIKQTDYNLVMAGSAISHQNYDKQNPWNYDLVLVQKEIYEDKRFIVLGFVPDSDLNLIYNLATVLVMPSLYEGFGLPILEAMQAGCPVLTSNVSSLPEVGGDAAMYCNPEDLSDIKKNLELIVNNSELRRKMIERGIVQASRFSWKKTAQYTMAAYKKLLTIRENNRNVR